MFASVQILRKWRELRASNHVDLDSNGTGEVGTVYYTGVDLIDLIFLTSYVTVVGLRLKWYTPYCYTRGKAGSCVLTTVVPETA
jgi:hypothetical protein